VKHDDPKDPRFERFRALVESYGADPARWPESEREAMRELASSDAARAFLAEQRRLDAWLDDAPDVAPSANLLRRVAEIPARNEAASSGWVWPFGRLRNLIAVGTAAAAMGLVVGMTTTDASQDGSDEWDELSSLALGVDVAEAP
jgi:hypothetical protein